MKCVATDGLYKMLNLPHDHSQIKSALFSSVSLSVYQANKLVSMVSVSCCVNCINNENSRVNKTRDLWHMRLGHPNVVALKKTLSACNISTGNKFSKLSFCKACHLGKQHKLSFNSSDSKPLVALKIIHIDLWGPALTLQTKASNTIYISLMTKLITLGFMD